MISRIEKKIQRTKGFASFRNFLAHDYDRIDFDSVCKFANDKMDEVLAYTRYIQDALSV